jgi:hypothetical protein
MRSAEPDVLAAVFPKIIPSMTSSQRAGLLVQSLLQNGADLRTQPALEEMKSLFTKVMRFRKCETRSNNSPQAI